MSGLKSTTIVDGPTATKRLEMGDTRRRGHDHTCSGRVSPPANFKILTMKRNGRVETTKGFEEISPYERHRSGNEEHVAHRVVLLLVEISSFDIGRRMAKPVCTHTNREQPSWLAPLNDFGSNDSGIRSKCLFDQQSHHIWIETNIVVTEQIERGALHSNESFIGSGGVARVFGKATKMSIGENCPHPVSELGPICACSINDENGKGGIVLGTEAGKRLFKPITWVMGDHHRDDSGGRPFRFLCLEEGFETWRWRSGFGRSVGTLAQGRKKVFKDRLGISTR